MRRLAFTTLLSLALSSSACDRSASIRLPDPSPQADLAFGVLYDGETPTVVGELVARQAVYSGRYALNGASGLSARLYFLRIADLEEAAQAVCASEPSAALRLLCSERIQACADDPTSCWRAVASVDGCAQDLDLGENIVVQAYASQDGRLDLLDTKTAPAVRLCGPTLTPGCPNRRAGYVVTEDGKFACVAEVRQLDCNTTVYAPDCGLPQFSATLSERGELASLDAAGCEASAPSAAVEGVGAAADFGLDCAGHRLSFHPQQDLLAAPECVRRGPATFETNAPVSGRIFDVRSMRIGGGPARLVSSGSGADSCASYGCGSRGQDCNTACQSGCSSTVELEPCSRDSWQACVPVSERDACLDRCRLYCTRPTDASCYAETAGMVLVSADPEAPESDLSRIDEDATNNQPPAGRPTLAQPAPGWLASLTSGQLNVYAGDSADTLASRGRFETGMVAAGLVSPSDDALVWFGQVAEVSTVRTAALLRDQAASLTVDPVDIELPDLPDVDRGVLGGPGSSWLFLASVAPQLSSQARNQVHVVDLGTRVELAPVPLPGPVTALLSLGDGAVLAAYLTALDRPGLVVLRPGAQRVEAVDPINLVPGVVVQDMALAADSCLGGTRCTILLGLQSEHGAAPAVLSAVAYDASAQPSLILTPNFRATGAQSLDQLVVDLDGRRVWAVASQRNVLSPFVLSE